MSRTGTQGSGAAGVYLLSQSERVARRQQRDAVLRAGLAGGKRGGGGGKRAGRSPLRGGAAAPADLWLLPPTGSVQTQRQSRLDAARLRGSDNIALRLDRARAEQDLPMRLARLHCKCARHEEQLAAMDKGELLIELWEA